jgi:phage-related protein
MATFPSIEASYGIQKSSKPDVRTVQFGDGYVQRLRYSYLNNPKVWSVTFNNITETDSDTIETFLDARASDAASFDWTPPGEGSALKFFCYEWNKTISVPNRATIQATFTQVFEP